MVSFIWKTILKILFKKRSKLSLRNSLADEEEARRAIDREATWHFKAAGHDYKNDPYNAPIYHYNDPSNDI
jgi:hypothetical protein